MNSRNTGTFMAPSSNGKLRLYNAYPRNYKSFAAAIIDLKRIGEKGLGFNAVWINPINATSEICVERLNLITGANDKVRGSLYATRDFSQLNYRLFPDLHDPSVASTEPSGDPSFCTSREKVLLRKYTDEARNNGMMPIFDLVLNHVALDSPLVKGEFKHFKEQGVDTSKWFKANNKKNWDDIIPFNYENPEILEEIFQHLWLPYIIKYISQFGFMGVRVDYATGISPIIQKHLFLQIKKMVKATFGVEAIIFAESLPPKALLQNIALTYRELYTHVTNNTVAGPTSALKDMQLKQQMTHLKIDSSSLELPCGTVGFASSHDEGPNARNALQVVEYDALSKEEERELEKTTTQLITSLKSASAAEVQDWITKQRKRLALCALVSDGGTCLLSGDEFSDETPKSVFETTNGHAIYDEAANFAKCLDEKRIDHSHLIKNLNLIIDDLPRSTYPHYFSVVDLENPYHNLAIVIQHKDKSVISAHNTDLMIVNLSEHNIHIDTTVIKLIAEKYQTQYQVKENISDILMSANKRLIGRFSSNLTNIKIYNSSVVSVKAPNQYRENFGFIKKPQHVSTEETTPTHTIDFRKFS